MLSPITTTAEKKTYPSYPVKELRVFAKEDDMKFSCEKHLLQAAVAAASRAASAKSPISALEGLLIEAGSGVRVTGYDLKKGI